MPIEVVGFDPALLGRIPFEVAAVGGGVIERLLEVWPAEVVGLPADLDGLLVAADLQGRERPSSGSGPGRLVGLVLADWLSEFIRGESGLERERVGVLLAGDLYAWPELDRRGASGDVREVWRAFADEVAWVAGVAGNHDKFGQGWPPTAFGAFGEEPGINVLDGDVVEWSGVRVAGLSGVVGNPRRPFRRTRQAFEAEAARLAGMTPDVLVLHEGPDVAGSGLRGNAGVREVLERARATLVVCGHAFWDRPGAALANGVQVLNVDGRAVWLRRAR